MISKGTLATGSVSIGEQLDAMTSVFQFYRQVNGDNLIQSSASCSLLGCRRSIDHLSNAALR